MNKNLACLIPCFNESKNLKYLCKEIELNNDKNIDWYLINNGSEDVTYEQFKKIIYENNKLKNLKTFYIEQNKGYGYGIKKCMSEIGATYNAFCWTHADAQTPISDVIKTYVLLEKPNFDLIKGRRISERWNSCGNIYTF